MNNVRLTQIIVSNDRNDETAEQKRLRGEKLMRRWRLCVRERAETCDCVSALLGPDQSYYVLMTLAHLGCCEILVSKLAAVSVCVFVLCV